MLVTIFDRPGTWRRVRELAPGSVQAVTVKWCSSEQAAVDYIRENYPVEQVVSPDAFLTEVQRRRAHPEVRNG